MYVVVMGCGRVGASLAGALQRIGHEVSIIDRDEAAFLRLDPDFTGPRVVGMGFDRDVLVEAGIEKAEAFAAVSSGDNSNIIAARVARETFGVEKVVARIYDAKRAAVYERLGIPTVATVPWATDRFLHNLLRDDPTTKWRDPSGSVAVVLLDCHDGWIGKKLSVLEDATRSRAAFVIRFGSGLLPDKRTVIQAGDEIYVAAVSGTVAEALALAGNPPPADQ
ncbi:TrkA family potassium uptake protein [Rhodococcus sp. KRD162]|uniref:potassium channel family protein n=1 Tax=Rhodococcus sp. KRD162 TaxID=2729725 RepID=UPI0019D1A1A2|nr:TrkA family potassium uptake protein [Rhodococcus sp. KRD162]